MNATLKTYPKPKNKNGLVGYLWKQQKENLKSKLNKKFKKECFNIVLCVMYINIIGKVKRTLIKIKYFKRECLFYFSILSFKL